MTVYWKSLDDFLAMGGYGAYVWGAFGMAGLCLVVELWGLRQRRKALTSLISENDE